MDAKTYLSRAVSIEQEITVMLEQLDELKAQAEKTTTALHSSAAGDSSIRRRMADSVDKMVDLQYRLNDTIDAFVDTKAEIIDTLSKIPNNTMRLILEMRYLSNKDWDEICMLLHLSRSRIMTIHAHGLKKIEKILKEST